MSNPALSLRFSADKELFDELLADESIGPMAKRRLQECSYTDYKKHLLGQSLRVKRSMAPALFRALDKSSEMLGMQQYSKEVYVQNDPQMNASCALESDEKVLLTFSSAILKAMNQPELEFIVGHEMGHALFDHHALPTNGLMQSGEISAKDALKLMAWSRRAEISADRAGLYVCGDVGSAVQTFVKLSCGLDAEHIQFDYDEYSEQIRDITAMANSLEETSDYYNSHPFNPIRILALDVYAKAGIELTQAANDTCYGVERVDGEVSEALLIMEPLPEEKQQAVLDTAQFWSGIWVAAIDDDIADCEIENLKENIQDATFEALWAELPSTGKAAFAKERFIEAAEALKGAPAPERCAFLQRSISIARADNDVSEAEIAVLHESCRILAVEQTFVNNILSFLE